VSAKLVWITPDAERLIGYIARVSNPANQDNPDVAGLIRYMIRKAHWSPFEMASMCVEVDTTRDIARQMLRHRSFVFQELSQRYSSDIDFAEPRECRLQDKRNRQSSLSTDDVTLQAEWEHRQRDLTARAEATYMWAIERGIAKEQARAILPEGLTLSRLYMSGTLRSWLHYVGLRTDKATQREHRDVAEAIGAILAEQVPTVWRAFVGGGEAPTEPQEARKTSWLKA
jgi:thymidylate synthase (FAD)